MSDLKDLVWRLIKDRFITQVYPAEVIAVNKEEDTINIKPYDEGPEIEGVRLTATIGQHSTKFVIYPEIGSIVLIAVIEDQVVDNFVCSYSDIDEVAIVCDNIRFNDGELGGLVKIKELVSRLNAVEDRMAKHQHLFNGSPTQTDFATNSPIDKTTKEDLENNKITHG